LGGDHVISSPSTAQGILCPLTPEVDERDSTVTLACDNYHNNIDRGKPVLTYRLDRRQTIPFSFSFPFKELSDIIIPFFYRKTTLASGLSTLLIS
jgi:hypothetical protein